jgi:hypothetical protein
MAAYVKQLEWIGRMSIARYSDDLTRLTETMLGDFCNVVEILGNRFAALEDAVTKQG